MWKNPVVSLLIAVAGALVVLMVLVLAPPATPAMYRVFGALGVACGLGVLFAGRQRAFKVGRGSETLTGARLLFVAVPTIAAGAFMFWDSYGK